MKRILTISLSLKNAYRVNSILYMLQQTPIIKHFLPDNIYCSFKLKSLANTLSVIWEILSVFVVKLLYFGIKPFHAAGAGSSVRDDGVDELDFQTALHGLVQTHMWIAVFVIERPGTQLVHVTAVIL